MQNDGPSYESLPSGLGPASFGPFNQVFKDLPSFPTVASGQPEQASPDPGFIMPLPLAFEPLVDASAGLAAATGEQSSESSPSGSSASAEPDGAAFGDVSYMAGHSLAASAVMPGRREQREQSTLQLSGLTGQLTAPEAPHDAATSQQPPPCDSTSSAQAVQSRGEASVEPPACAAPAISLGLDWAQAEPMAAVGTGQPPGLGSMASVPPGPSMSEAPDQASPSTSAAISLEHDLAETEHMAEHEDIQGTMPELAMDARLAPDSDLPAAEAEFQPTDDIDSAPAAQALPQQASDLAVQLLDSNTIPDAAAVPGPELTDDKESLLAQQRSNAPGGQPASPPATLLGMSKAQAKRARQAAARARAAQGAQQSGHKRGWQEWLGKGPGEPQWASERPTSIALDNVCRTSSYAQVSNCHAELLHKLWLMLLHMCECCRVMMGTLPWQVQPWRPSRAFTSMCWRAWHDSKLGGAADIGIVDTTELRLVSHKLGLGAECCQSCREAEEKESDVRLA